MKFFVLLVSALVVVTATDDATEGTSFIFSGTQYTFYPGQTAVNFDQAQAFCLSKKKILAMFDLRTQLLNASEYISEEGGVWTNYRTDKDALFATADKNKKHPWQEEFAMPNSPERTSSEASKCGLLSLVGSDSGIVPIDCATKKAALCSLDPTAKPASPKSTPTTKPTAKPAMKTTAKVTPKTGEMENTTDSTTGKPTDSATDTTTPKPKRTVGGNKTEPIVLTVDGTTFTYYPKVIQFGGWMEACQYCTDHDDQQAAVFTSVAQLKKVLTELNAKAFWTGYSSNGKGEPVTVDTEAPWIPEFGVQNAIGIPKAMCGAASVMLADKYAIRWQPCISPKTVLCSAKQASVPTIAALQ